MQPAFEVPFTDLGAMAREVWPDIQTVFTEALLQGRYIGDGTLQNTLVEGVNIESNHVDSAFYADLALSYRWELGEGAELELFGQVTNLLDEDPPITAYYSAFLGYSQQYNPSLFDVLGRRYTLGFRLTR